MIQALIILAAWTALATLLGIAIGRTIDLRDGHGMRFTDTVKDTVRDRSRRSCERCGLPCFTGAHFHHRRARSMGGSRNPAVGTPANCLYLCPSCHVYIERNREESYRKGWLVRDRYDPSTVPVDLYDGTWMLRVDGGLTLVHQRHHADRSGTDR